MTTAYPTPTLAEEPPGRQADILLAIAAVESSRGPVLARHLKGLIDPSLRRVVEACLNEAGRTLVPSQDGLAFASGFRDDITEALVARGHGVLSADDRAVLALVLLLSVAVPRARGSNKGTGWTDGDVITVDELKRSQIPDYRVKESLSRLRNLGLVAYGGNHQIRPGPQLDRLTPAASGRLWEDLILIAAPDSVEALHIQTRRTQDQERP